MAQREGERISPQLHRDGGGFGEGSNPSWRAAAGSVYPHQLRARPTQPRPPLSATGPATPAPGQSQPPSCCSGGRAIPEVTAPSGEEGCQHRESGGGLSCHWIPRHPPYLLSQDSPQPQVQDTGSPPRGREGCACPPTRGCWDMAARHLLSAPAATDPAPGSSPFSSTPGDGGSNLVLGAQQPPGTCPEEQTRGLGQDSARSAKLRGSPWGSDPWALSGPIPGPSGELPAWGSKGAGAPHSRAELGSTSAGGWGKGSQGSSNRRADWGRGGHWDWGEEGCWRRRRGL